MNGADRLPSLIAFDIDYTLWDLWIDTHVQAPFRRTGNTLNQVLDRYNQEIAFYPDVSKILHDISGKTTLALCSRTNAPDYARDVLRLLLVPPPPNDPDADGAPPEPKRAFDYFPQKEIYPGSKINHFKALHRKTGIPYSEMLFYDDESRNKDVESLGVTFVLVSSGLNSRSFWGGVEKWRKKNPVVTSSDGEV